MWLKACLMVICTKKTIVKSHKLIILHSSGLCSDMCIFGVLVQCGAYPTYFKNLHKMELVTPWNFAVHHCAPIYAVWSNLRGSICIFWTVGIISVLDGDRNKAVLVAKIFVLLQLQWVSLFRETKGSWQCSWSVGWVKDQFFGNLLFIALQGQWQVL